MTLIDNKQHTQQSKNININRMTIKLNKLPLQNLTKSNILKDCNVLVVYYDDDILGKKLIKELQKNNVNIVVFQLLSTLQEKSKSNSSFSLYDFNEIDIRERLEHFINKEKINGFIYIHPKSGIFKNQKNKFISSFQSDKKKIEILFLLTKYLSCYFTKTCFKNNKIFITITRIDGMLGLSGTISESLYGAIYALTKTFKKEYFNARCRAIDIDPKLSLTDALESIFKELFNTDQDVIEVAYNKRGRFVPVIEKDLTTQLRSEPVLNSQDTLLVTGGAKGITSECVKELARRFHCNFILLGRTNIDMQEQERLTNYSDEQELKKSISIANPARTQEEIEQICKKLIAKKNIQIFLEEIKEYANNVIYLSVDITILNDLKEKFKQINNKKIFPITGIIHGAGVVADNLVYKKPLQEFREVFLTKVQGLENILKCVPLEQLKVIFLFSSIAACYGNVGQLDYAMANAVLDKSAYVLQNLYPNTHVTAINWGPWDGGMVSSELKKIFLQLGIKLIPKKVGAATLCDEIQLKSKTAQIIIDIP